MKKLPLKSLKKKLWKQRSEYYRLRDANFQGYVACFTCNKVKHWRYGDAGHYLSRIHDFTSELLTEDRNVHFQCKGCNGYRSGMQPEYAIHLQAKYGDGVLVDLQAKRNASKTWKYSEIEKLIEIYKQRVRDLER